MPNQISAVVEKPTTASKPPIIGDVYINTKISAVKEMAPMSLNSTLQPPSEYTVRHDLVLVQCSSISTSVVESESSNADPSTGCFGSEREYVTQEQQEGEICEKDKSKRIEWRIKKLSAEIRQLQIENDRLKLELKSVQPEQNKLKRQQDSARTKTHEYPLTKQVDQLSKGHGRTKSNSSAAVRIWTQDQINRLTKLLIATKQIINKYAIEHRRLEESNKKLLRSNKFLTQSNTSLERQNQLLNQQSIEKETTIDKLQSRNLLLSTREKDCKKRLKRLEERLTGWAMSVLSFETNEKDDSEDQTCGIQVEGEKDEEIIHDNDIPGVLRETACKGEDPTPRSNLTSESEDEKRSYFVDPKMPAGWGYSKISDPNIRHIASDCLQQKFEEKKYPPVQHKFPRPIDRYPRKEGAQNDFQKFNRKFRCKKRKGKNRGRSRKRPPCGLELSGRSENKQRDQVHQHSYCSDESESNHMLAQRVLPRGNGNPNKRS